MLRLKLRKIILKLPEKPVWNFSSIERVEVAFVRKYILTGVRIRENNDNKNNSGKRKSFRKKR